MAGHKPFSELTKGFSSARRHRINEMAEQMLAQMPLHELRRTRAFTQQELAEKLNVNQPAVSKMEQRGDTNISSLRSYIEAVGGKLKITAEFPEGEVGITNYGQLADEGEEFGKSD